MCCPRERWHGHRSPLRLRRFQRHGSDVEAESLRRFQRTCKLPASPAVLSYMSEFGSTVAERQFGLFDAALTRYSANTVLPWHEHDRAYLTFVVDGDYRESLAGFTRDCTRRSIVYHPAGEAHADHFGPRNAFCLDVGLDPKWLRLLSDRGCTIDRAAMLDSPSASLIAARVAGEFHEPDELSPIVVEGLLFELFVEKQRHRPVTKAPLWLRRVRDLLESRCGERISLSDAATVAGVHPTHLSRVFRAHYGCTIGDFVRAARIDLAKQRLLGTDSLSDIATSLGFADQSHFARTFRLFTGQSPNTFRRAAR
jgi:AraC family transcriptional regulator